VITAHEALVAVVAREVFFPGVRPHVAGQLVGAREPLLAGAEVAAERPLA